MDPGICRPYYIHQVLNQTLKNKYIFNHNFGYGRENELDELFKLNLRDFQDLKDYIDFVLNIPYVDNNI